MGHRQLLMCLGLLTALLICAWPATAVDDAPAAVAPLGMSELTLGVGWNYVDVSGNERRFDQYVTPPNRLYPSTVGYIHRGYADGVDLDLSLSTLGEPGRSGEAWLDLGQILSLHGQYRRSVYYFDFEPTSERSRRRDWLLGWATPAGTRDWFFVGDYGEVTLAGLPAAGAVDWTQQQVRGAAGVRVGNFLVSLDGSQQDFSDDAGRSLSGDTRVYGLSLASLGTGKTSVAGSVHRATTRVDLFGANDVATWEANLSASHALTDRLNLTATGRTYQVDETIVANGYADRSNSLRLQADYQLLPRTALTGYVSTTNVDYVDGWQANTVQVASTGFGAQLRSRLNSHLKVRARYDRLDNTDRPLAYQLDGSFANTLIWSDLSRADLQFTYTPGTAPWGATAQWGWRQWQNDARETDNELQTTSLMAWWLPAEGTTVTGTWFRHNYEFPVLDPASQGGYASQANTFVLGATQRVNAQDSVSATLTQALTSGATDNSNTRFTLGYAREVTAHDRFSAEFSLGDFADTLDDNLDYSAQVVRLEWLRNF